MFTVFTKINDKLEDRKQETIKKRGHCRLGKKQIQLLEMKNTITELKT